MQDHHIKIHPEISRAATLIAAERDISLGQLIRDLLSKEISRCRKAKPPVRADERLVAPLRARLAEDFAHAENWTDMQNRLKSKGYILQAAGGGLALHSWPQNQRICKASELGFSYSRLMRRLHSPFPGHSHVWLFDKISGEQTGPPDDMDVIEPWEA